MTLGCSSNHHAKEGCLECTGHKGQRQLIGVCEPHALTRTRTHKGGGLRLTLALLQLGGRLLQSNISRETITTCYVHTILNLGFLREITGVVLSEEVSARVGLLQMVASRDFACFVEGLRQCSQTQCLLRQTFPLLGGKE